MAILGLGSKKKVVGDDGPAGAHQDDAKALLEQIEMKKQASPDTCMFC